MYAGGKVVAAVCHGPIALAHAKGPDGEYIVKGMYKHIQCHSLLPNGMHALFRSGKRVAGFTNEEEDVVKLWESLPDQQGLGKSVEQVFLARGAIYGKAAAFQPHVEVDGTILTGQNPASAGKLGEEIVKYFSNKGK
jgi:putative intracellular protease/amidase